MSLLIADSGSTKTNWCHLDAEGKLDCFRSEGINPYYHSKEDIQRILQYIFDNKSTLKGVNRVYFYGAGCTNNDRKKAISDAIRKIFDVRLPVKVHSDLIGAAKACCGDDEGIVCILGTGSNSCVYNGSQVIDQIPSLGFILGDEGSGAHIGKKIIQSYFYREMPADLMAELEQRFDMSRNDVLDAVYSKPHPNRYVSDFSRFSNEFREHPFIKKLVESAFSEFIDRHILYYPDCNKYRISFVGSVAHYNRDILEDLLKDRHLHMNKVIKDPMEGLVEYHLQRDF
jgi:glucosamine kinase